MGRFGGVPKTGVCETVFSSMRACPWLCDTLPPRWWHRGMLTDLIFDFFGTLVSYTHGMAPDASYGTTHRLLLDCGFSVEYDVFIRELNQVFKHLDQQAKPTCV